MKAIKKTSAKDKKKDNNQECARVQSRNRRVSEVGWEICTHNAQIAKGCYIQRDSGELGPHLIWVDLILIMDFMIPKGLMRTKMQS